MESQSRQRESTRENSFVLFSHKSKSEAGRIVQCVCLHKKFEKTTSMIPTTFEPPSRKSAGSSLVNLRGDKWKASIGETLNSKIPIVRLDNKYQEALQRLLSNDCQRREE